METSIEKLEASIKELQGTPDIKIDLISTQPSRYLVVSLAL
jgi:hypothetical protein